MFVNMIFMVMKYCRLNIFIKRLTVFGYGSLCFDHSVSVFVESEFVVISKINLPSFT